MTVSTANKPDDRRMIRVLGVVVLIGYIVIGGLGVFAYRWAHQSKDAGCLIRATAEARVDLDQVQLSEASTSAQRSKFYREITVQKNLIENLSGLDC